MYTNIKMGRWGSGFLDIAKNVISVPIPAAAFTSLKNAKSAIRTPLKENAFKKIIDTTNSRAFETIGNQINEFGFAKIAKQGGNSDDFIIATKLKNGDYVPDVEAALIALGRRGNGAPVVVPGNKFTFGDVGGDIFEKMPTFNVPLGPSTRQQNIPASLGRNATDTDTLAKGFDDYMKTLNLPWYKNKKIIITGAVVVVGGVAVGITINELVHYFTKKKYTGSIKKIKRQGNSFELTLDPKMPKLNAALFQNRDQVGVVLQGLSEDKTEDYKCLQAKYKDNYLQTENRNIITVIPAAHGECRAPTPSDYDCDGSSCGIVTIDPGNIASLFFEFAGDAAKAATNAFQKFFEKLFGDNFAIVSGVSVCCILTIAAAFIFIFLKPG